MKVPFDISALPIEEQKRLYLYLKAKFDPDNPSIYTDAEFKKEVMLNKHLEELNMSMRAFNGLKASRINTVRELCDRTRSQLKNINNFGNRSLEEVEALLSEIGLSLKAED